MRALVPISLVVVLAVSALGGWRSDCAGILRLAGLWAVVLLIHSLPFGRVPRSFLDRWGFALAAVVFLFFSGVGVFPSPALGIPGFVLIHGAILIAYGAFLAGVFRRAYRDEKMDEDFMRIDVWVLNLGLCCFVFIALLDIFRTQPSVLSVLHALAKAVMLLGFLLLALLSARVIKEGRGGSWFPLLVVGAITSSLILSGGRAFLVAYDLAMAKRLLAAKQHEAALAMLDRAQASNEILKSSAATTRELALRKEAYAGTGRYDEALALAGESLLRRLRSRLDGETLQLFKKYLAAEDLERSFQSGDRGIDLEELAQIHQALETLPAEEERLLVLFLENGFLDRLAERYAWSGFPQWSDPNALELALRRWRAQHPSDAWQAEFFLGLLASREERFSSARRLFQAALAKMPGHANAVTSLERALAAESKLTEVSRTRRLPRKITPAMVLGGTGAVSGRTTLYAALEMNPGTYVFEFDVRGCPSTSQRRRFEAYLDEEKEPFAQGILKSSDWTRVRAERGFLNQERHRLLLVFEDLGERPAQAEAGMGKTFPLREVDIQLVPK
jgi:tetratricopeptide (TPR) repeat protein